MQRNRRSDEEGERQQVDRITSYNVCYTKLLRRASIDGGLTITANNGALSLMTSNNMDATATGDGASATSAEGTSVGVGVAINVRITSYNVCYTKLLRIAHVAHEPVSAKFYSDVF